MPDSLSRLRLATEDDVIEACEASFTNIEAAPVDLLEFFNAMLDVLGVPDADGDIPA
jgi:hypothetical protein